MVITFASVWIGAVLAAGLGVIDPVRVTLGALAAGFIAAAGNVHNDICDIDIDRINRPERPLARGDADSSIAGMFAYFLAGTGIGIGILLGTAPLLIVITAVVLLYLYNSHLKMTVLWGNLAVSLLTALAFIFGAVLADNVAMGVVPAVFSLFFHFSREVIKDIEDLKGDAIRRGSTFAMKYGSDSAAGLAAGSLLTLMLLIPLPYLANLYEIEYILVCLFGVELPVAVVVYRLLRKKPDYRQMSGLLKFGMVMGLIALLVGH